MSHDSQLHINPKYIQHTDLEKRFWKLFEYRMKQDHHIGYATGRISGVVAGQIALHGTIYSQFGFNAAVVSAFISLYLAGVAAEARGGRITSLNSYLVGDELKGEYNHRCSDRGSAYAREANKLFDKSFDEDKKNAGLRYPKLKGAFAGASISLWQTVATPLAYTLLCATKFSKKTHSLAKKTYMITP